MTIIEQNKRKPGRPSKQVMEQRKKDRVPVGGFRDKLTVQNKDPNFYYRWVMDIDATGSRILRFLQADYVFVPPSEVIVGETYVFSSPDYGQIIRIPANRHGDFYYLMKLDKDLYDQDAALKQEHINETEQALHAPDSLKQAGGMYGSVKIDK